MIGLVVLHAMVAFGGEIPKDWVRAKVTLIVWQAAQTGEDLLPIHKGYYLQQGEDFVEVEMREGRRVEPLNYLGPPTFSLFSKTMTADGPSYTPVAGIRFGWEWRNVLIYVFPQADGKPPVLRAVDITGLAHKQGLVRLLNATRVPMRVIRVDRPGKVVEIPAGGTRDYDISDISDNHLQMKIAVKSERGWRQVYSGLTAASAQALYVGYLYEVPGVEGQFRFFLQRGLDFSPPDDTKAKLP